MAKRRHGKITQKKKFISTKSVILLAVTVITLIVAAYIVGRYSEWSSAGCGGGTSYYMGECREKDEITDIMNEINSGEKEAKDYYPGSKEANKNFKEWIKAMRERMDQKFEAKWEE